MDPQNHLLLQAFTAKMKEILKEEMGGINERIDQLKNNRNSCGDAKENRVQRLKLSIQPFKGRNDPEAYIQWETKIEELFSCHICTEEEKVKVAATKLSHYALVWWDKEQKDRRWYGEPVVRTWEEMRKMMRKRYANSYYLEELHKKKKRRKLKREEFKIKSSLEKKKRRVKRMK